MTCIQNNQEEVEEEETGSLSSAIGKIKTVKARFWPWLEPFLGVSP
jgi:hypothetical protein